MSGELLDAITRLTQIGEWVDTVGRDQQSPHDPLLVFDTDVLMMYMRPHAAANYCALMRSEASARAARRSAATSPTARPTDAFGAAELLLADMLGTYIVWGRAEPALNSPAHADELADISEAAIAGALVKYPVVTDLLRDGFQALADQYEVDASASGRSERLQAGIDDLVDRIWNEAPAVVQALRLTAALDGHRIYAMDSHRISHPVEPAAYLPSPYDAPNGDFLPEIRELARQIEKLLIAGASFGELKHKRIRDDALAIAHACWLNRQLASVASPRRVKLVSGTPYIHRLCAANDEWQARLPQHLADVLASLQPDFREIIRHPLGLIDEDGFREVLNFDGVALAGGRLGDLLRGRLPEHASQPEDAGLAIFESGAGGPLGSAPSTQQSKGDDRVGQAAVELASLLRAARARQSVSPEGSWLSQIAHEAIGARSSDWGRLIGERVHSLLPRFLASLVTIQRPPSVVARVARNVPPLVLPNFPAGQAFCDQLCHRNGRERMASHDAKHQITGMIAADPSLYTPLVAIALWRAAERDWNKAKIMTEASMAIADRIQTAREAGAAGRADDVTAPIFGEEAIYLCAVASRLTAGSRRIDQATADLDAALALLERADHCLRNSAAGIGDADQSRLLRHAAERCAAQVAKQLFQRLHGGHTASSTEADAAVFSLGMQSLEQALALPATAPGGAYLADYVVQQLCSSLAQMVLLDRYAVAGLEVFQLVARTWSEREDRATDLQRLRTVFGAQCQRLDDAGTAGTGPVVSTLVNAIWMAFDLEFAASLGVAQRQILRAKIDSWTERSNWIAPIDELRFNFLKKIAYRKIGYT